MKIHKLIELQSIIEGRAIPSDMNWDSMPVYYSVSKDQHLNIFFMDLVHVMRVLRNSLETIEGLKEEISELQGERVEYVIKPTKVEVERILNLLEEKLND